MGLGKLKKAKIDQYYNKPQLEQKHLADGDNLYVLVTKVGSCKFKYRVYTQEIKSWIALGDYPVMSLDEARQKALEIKAMIKNGIDPRESTKKAKIKEMTLADFSQVYIKERVPVTRKAGKSTKKFIYSLDYYVLSVLGKYQLAKITNEDIKNLVYTRSSKGQYSTARTIISILKCIFDYAIEKQLIDKTPVSNTKYYNLQSKVARKRNLSSDEIKTMMRLVYSSQTIKTKYKIAIHLLLMLLMRKTELIHATWDQVNFDEKIFNIETSKTGASLAIPLPEQAIKLFKILKDLSRGSQYIFSKCTDAKKPIHDTVINKHTDTINHIMFANDQEQYFTVHDLRRTGASRLRQLGYDRYWIEISLNHTKGGIEEIYQKYNYIKERQEMLQAWADEIDKLINDDQLLPYDKKFVI